MSRSEFILLLGLNKGGQIMNTKLMPKLIAIAPFDGWGYIEDGKNIFLIKPPYTSSINKIPVDRGQVETAITKCGFYALEYSFNSLGNLYKFLRETSKKLNKEIGRDTSPIGKKDMRQFFKNLPLSIIERHIDKIEENTKEGRNLETMRKIAEGILQSENENLKEGGFKDRLELIVKSISEKR